MHHSPSRRASAMMAAMGLVMIIASTAFLMSTVLVSDAQQESRRVTDVGLLVTTESMANAAYMAFQNGLEPMPAAPGAMIHCDDPSVWPGMPKTINGMSISAVMEMLDQPTQVFRLNVGAVAGSYRPDPSDPTHARRLDDNRTGQLVQMLIKAVPSNFFTQAMFALNGYNFMGSAQTDSYDSSVAPYAIPPGQSYNGNHGDIGSNGQLNVQNSGVHGTAKGNQNLVLPTLSYSAPAYATTIGGANGITSSYTFTVPGTYHASQLSIGKGDILRVQTNGSTVNLYVDSTVYFDSAQLQFDNTSSTLILWQNDGSSSTGFKLNGNTNFGQVVPTAGGTATQQSRPQQFQWYTLYSGMMDMNGTAAISCVMYAPKATVKANGTFDFMGSVTVAAFADTTGQGKVNGNFSFHYDTSLANMSTPFPPTLQVSGWCSRRMTPDEIDHKTTGVTW